MMDQEDIDYAQYKDDLGAGHRAPYDHDGAWYSPDDDTTFCTACSGECVNGVGGWRCLNCGRSIEDKDVYNCETRGQTNG